MTQSTAEQRIEEVAAELGLTMEATFVPWSRSRNAGEKQPSLNWKVSILRNGKPVLTTDYGAGMGHCPSYTQGKQTVDQAEAVKRECETGHRALPIIGGVGRSMGMPIKPKLADVLHSLVSDSDAIDHGTFEEWASDLGYDTESRKAEATYRVCLEIGLKLRNALGEDGLKKLREACQDY